MKELRKPDLQILIEVLETLSEQGFIDVVKDERQDSDG